MILENINSPFDLKKLKVSELPVLADEIRTAILERSSVCGGHVGSNLGVVELTIALHYIFNSPSDKFVFDVSHQCYTHKMLTGRKNAFLISDEYDNANGFTNPDESEHDFFKVGHSATSISVACGLARARDYKGSKENIIAIIGDGALSGGEAYEGLNFGTEQGTNLIIVLNDNGMAIAENHGGLYPHLKQLRESKGQCQNNIFKALGYEYLYVDNGNDIETLIETFTRVKDINHPIVVHIKTIKGNGYDIAVKAAENWHWRPPFFIENGLMKNDKRSYVGYDELTRDFLLEKMKNDPLFAVVVAAVPGSVRFYTEEREKAGKQFCDVGIAEEHAITMTAGMSKNGCKAVFVTDSTFYQRTYDQISHDVCLNKVPITMLIRNASIWGQRDVTHLGYFDISMISNIPNIVYLAPTNQEEYFAMLDWSIEQREHPVCIRIPKTRLYHATYDVDKDYSRINTNKVTRKGEKIAIFAAGDFYQIGEELADEIYSQLGILSTLINPRFLSGLDVELLDELKKCHSIVITLEDGVLEGGYGYKIASYYGDSNMRVLNYGLMKEYIDRYNPQEELEKCGISIPQILQRIEKFSVL